MLICSRVSCNITIPTPWKCGEVPTPWICAKGPTPWKHRKLCLSVIGYHPPQRFLLREVKEKFLHRRSVERVLYLGSMDDCTDPLLGIKYQNDSRNKR